MMPCSSCSQPLQPDEAIIFWRRIPSGYKDFIHAQCEDEWVTFLELSGIKVDSPTLRGAHGRLKWREAMQCGWQQVLYNYELELRAKGLLPNDKEETQIPAETDCVAGSQD